MDNSRFERILCSSRSDVSLTIASCWLVLLVSGPPLHAMQNEPDARLPADWEVTDASIAERLNAIYAEIEAWNAIDASVARGVVTLDGEVFSSAAAEDAAALAERIDGVLLVRNQVAIATDLESRFAPAGERLTRRVFDFVAWLPVLVVAVGIVLLFVWLSRLAATRSWIDRRLSSNPFLADISRQLIRIAILLLGIILALELLDATALVGAVLGTAGVAGLAIGFAFKDIVENYIASILLSVRQPFAPNDHIVVDGQDGKVVRLTSRATILLTMDGNHLRIPNAAVFKSTILNYTKNPLRRFDFAVGVGTEDEIGTARRLGIEGLTRLESVMDEPEPWAVVETLGDSNVLVRFFGWVDQTAHDFLKVRSAALVAVKTALDDAGIEMPEPIFRVRTVAIETPVHRRRSRPSSGEDVDEMDVAADREIERQAAADRSAGGEDLLSTRAPQE
ncbi:MAG TPA: mechanosensitive ion channel family protein [Vicinamibacteria bacterium]|nr:mechanosensitive ion channel family protein [Vicinamibacteria bacterium]